MFAPARVFSPRALSSLGEQSSQADGISLPNRSLTTLVPRECVARTLRRSTSTPERTRSGQNTTFLSVSPRRTSALVNGRPLTTKRRSLSADTVSKTNRQTIFSSHLHTYTPAASSADFKRPPSPTTHKSGAAALGSQDQTKETTSLDTYGVVDTWSPSPKLKYREGVVLGRLDNALAGVEQLISQIEKDDGGLKTDVVEAVQNSALNVDVSVRAVLEAVQKERAARSKDIAELKAKLTSQHECLMHELLLRTDAKNLPHGSSEPTVEGVEGQGKLLDIQRIQHNRLTILESQVQAMRDQLPENSLSVDSVVQEQFAAVFYESFTSPQALSAMQRAINTHSTYLQAFIDEHIGPMVHAKMTTEFVSLSQDIQMLSQELQTERDVRAQGDLNLAARMSARAAEMTTALEEAMGNTKNDAQRLTDELSMLCGMLKEAVTGEDAMRKDIMEVVVKYEKCDGRVSQLERHTASLDASVRQLDALVSSRTRAQTYSFSQ